MPIPIAAIAKLLVQLTVLTPLVNESFEKLGKLVVSVRRGGSTTSELEEHLRKALELQNDINREMNEQLRIVKSVLDNVQRSLRLLGLAVVGTGLMALLAMGLVLLK